MKSLLLIQTIAFLLAACSQTSSMDPAIDRASGGGTAAMSASASAAPNLSEQSAPVDAKQGNTARPLAHDAEVGADADRREVNEAIDSNLGDHEKYQTVILALQKSVAAGDANAVAELVDYPISVEIGGKATILKGKQAFVSRYGDFMTKEITKAIVDTKYSELFVNWKGVMFGSGEAWVNGICKDSACNAFDVKLVTLQSAP